MRRRIELLWLALVLVGALLFAEGMLHALSRASVTVQRALAAPWEVDVPVIADPRVIYRGNPLYVQHDARGYRNPSAFERADVVVFGDSHTYGTLVDPDDAWPRHLERLTGRSTYSMALPGIGATHAQLKLDEAMALHPRVIAVAPYFGNDLLDAFLLWRANPDFVDGIDPEMRAAADRAETSRALLDELRAIWPVSQHSEPAAPDGLRRFLSRHVKLYGLLRSIRWRLSEHETEREIAGYFSPEYEKAVAALPPASRGFALPVDAGGFRTILTPQRRGRVLDDDDPRIRLGYEVLLRALAQVSERCRSAGVRLIVVPMPTKEAVWFPRIADPESIGGGLVEAVADEERLLRDWTDEMDRLGIERVDVLAAFRASRESVYFEHADGHPNAVGHRLVAELVAAELASTQARR